MYKYDEKKIKVFGKTHTSYYPEKHSTVTAIIFKRWDNNAGDSWANISDNRTILYVLWKGYHNWERLCDGEYGKLPRYTVRDGLFALLHSMENDDRKREIWRGNKIKELEVSIKKDEKLLIDLEKEEATEKKEDIKCR